MQAGCVQYLINNAGVAKWADLGSLQEEDMLHLFRTNTLGPLMITQEVLREGLLKSGSVVANMTSKVSHLQYYALKCPNGGMGDYLCHCLRVFSCRGSVHSK